MKSGKEIVDEWMSGHLAPTDRHNVADRIARLVSLIDAAIADAKEEGRIEVVAETVTENKEIAICSVCERQIVKDFQTWRHFENRQHSARPARGTIQTVSCVVFKEDALASAREQQRKKDVEAIRGLLKLCQCRGTGFYRTDCTLCGDSTFDHYCNDKKVACERPECVSARSALAAIEATKEGEK